MPYLNLTPFPILTITVSQKTEILDSPVREPKASKMETAQIADFVSMLPDDSVVEAGEIVRPRGYNVADSIAAELRDKGWSVSAVTQQGFYGWTFQGTTNGVSFQCILGYNEPWHLLVIDRRWFVKRWFGSVHPFVALLTEIDSAMKATGHVSDLNWITTTEYERLRQE